MIPSRPLAPLLDQRDLVVRRGPGRLTCELPSHSAPPTRRRTGSGNARRSSWLDPIQRAGLGCGASLATTSPRHATISMGPIPMPGAAKPGAPCSWSALRASSRTAGPEPRRQGRLRRRRRRCAASGAPLTARSRPGSGLRCVRLTSAAPARSRTPILVRGIAVGAALVGAAARRSLAPIPARCHGGTAEKRGQKPITADVAVPWRRQAARWARSITQCADNEIAAGRGQWCRRSLSCPVSCLRLSCDALRYTIIGSRIGGRRWTKL